MNTSYTSTVKKTKNENEEGTKSMLAYVSLKDYITDPKQENEYTGNHDIYLKVINVLLIGRSQAGKSTLLTTLQNPLQAVQGRGFSVTKEPQMKTFIVNDDHNNTSYTINVIDTPGLTEKRIDDLSSRSDEEIVRIIKHYILKQITHLNIIIYVTVAKRTHELDTEAFQCIKVFLGDEFESNSLLVISHCEEIPKKRIEQIIDDMKTFPETNAMINYCKLGVLPYGTINADHLSLADEDTDDSPEEKETKIRKKVHNTVKRIEKMRQDLLLAIIKTAYQPRVVSQLGRNYYIKEQERKEIKSAFDVAKKIWDNELQKKKQYANMREVKNNCETDSFKEKKIQCGHINGEFIKQADKVMKVNENNQLTVLAERKLYVIEESDDRNSHLKSFRKNEKKLINVKPKIHQSGST